MYIQSVVVKNIRILKEVRCDFSSPFEGWHVILGENGSGKSSFIRSVSLALIGPLQIPSLKINEAEWLNKAATKGYIRLDLKSDKKLDKQTGQARPLTKYLIPNYLEFIKDDYGVSLNSKNLSRKLGGAIDAERYNWGRGPGWFSVGYGPFRRFKGGNPDWSKVFYAAPRAGAHLSVFSEDVALTEASSWLVELDTQIKRFNQRGLLATEEILILNKLKEFLNTSDLLPHSTQFMGIEGKNLVFRDGNSNEIPIDQLSDGYRSILSLTFELIRQLVNSYGAKQVFKNISASNTIDLPGVVLIDEVDAHLHPAWQTRIGSWFTKHFPKLQFIVTTHSPLICRGVSKNKGSIFRLAAPGSPEPSGFVTDLEKEKLISGSILDAFDTELFGEEAARNEANKISLKRLGELNMLSALGQITPDQEFERIQLQKVHSSDAPTGF